MSDRPIISLHIASLPLQIGSSASLGLSHRRCRSSWNSFGGLVGIEVSSNMFSAGTNNNGIDSSGQIREGLSRVLASDPSGEGVGIGADMAYLRM